MSRQPSHPRIDDRTTRAANFAALVVLAGVLLGGTAEPARAAQPPANYSFEVLAALPQAAPGIPLNYLARDFEIGGFNNSSTGFWGADFNLTATQPPWAPAVGEGLWTTRPGRAPALVARSGGFDPEGATFSDGFPGPVSINDAGDGAFAFRLLPAPPSGALSVLNSGVYRYSQETGQVTTIAKTGDGTFAGFNFGTSINGRGDVAFHGVTKTHPLGTYDNPADSYNKYGVGIYRADRQGNIEPVVEVGDPAPSGGNFDNVRNAWLNDRGDVAFGGHTTAPGEVSCTTATTPLGNLSCAESIYLKHANDGSIESIAHHGDPAPVPGNLKYDYAFGPRINNRGELVFIGCLTAIPATTTSCGPRRGVFLYRDGAVEAIVYPGLVFQAEGDSYTAVRASNTVNSYFINDLGDVVFTLSYDTDNNLATIESGVFAWSSGVYETVAKTGDVLPGIGTVLHAEKPAQAPAATAFPAGYSLNNNRGQVMFQVTLTDGTGKLLVATP